MFESELELEKKQSSFGPLLMVTVLVVMIVGGLAWFIYQQRRGLPMEEATAAINKILTDKGPALVRFHTGEVPPVMDDQPSDPQYRLLEKAGLITIGKMKGVTTPIALTADAETKFAAIPGYKKRDDGDKETLHIVPLATRKLVSIDKVTMVNAQTAKVDYTWKWVPNAIGDIFDASGDHVKGFGTWERSTLIQKHGADFYHGDPTKMEVVLTRGDQGWSIAP